MLSLRPATTPLFQRFGLGACSVLSRSRTFRLLCLTYGKTSHETGSASFELHFRGILSVIFRCSLSASLDAAEFGGSRSERRCLLWLLRGEFISNRHSFRFIHLFLLSLLLPAGMPSVELRSCTAPQGWWHCLERGANLLVQFLEVAHRRLLFRLCCLLLCLSLGFPLLPSLLSMESSTRLRYA